MSRKAFEKIEAGLRDAIAGNWAAVTIDGETWVSKKHQPYHYGHMCRDDHLQIGHADSEHEQCPLCRALGELERLYERYGLQSTRDVIDQLRGCEQEARAEEMKAEATQYRKCAADAGGSGMSNVDLLRRLIEQAEHYSDGHGPLHAAAANAIANMEMQLAARSNLPEIGLMASDVACYKWPDDSELHRACRAAFIEGAQHGQF